ncbi:MAG TPA: DivIVA domain-containing protein [Gaiellaceae bacterium]
MSLAHLLRERELAVRPLGYDRATTDELLRAVEATLAAVIAERDRLSARLEAAERELEHLRAHEGLYRDVLLAAEAVKAEAERRAEFILAGARHQARTLAAQTDGGPPPDQGPPRADDELADVLRSRLGARPALPD